MKVEVEVKDEKIFKFFDILNALKDDYVVDFNAPFVASLEDIKDVEYEDETASNLSQSIKEGVSSHN